MTDAKDVPIWHVPILVVAGVLAILGGAIVFATWFHAIPRLWGNGIAWGAAGATATFTIARIVHIKSVTRRELELLVAAIAIVIATTF